LGTGEWGVTGFYSVCARLRYFGQSSLDLADCMRTVFLSLQTILPSGFHSLECWEDSKRSAAYLSRILGYLCYLFSPLWLSNLRAGCSICLRVD
jgi:hypothetical protein